MAFDCITVRREGAIEHVVLNRPAVRNAFNEHAIRELTWWADSAAKDPTLRLAILSGAGPVFCAGADVTWVSDEFLQEHEVGPWMELALWLPDPEWAGMHATDVSRAALGGGAGLCAVCDIVVAADDAVFGFTEV